MADRGSRARPSLRTRVVGVMRYVLPMFALALLAAVFLWSEDDDLGIGLTFSDADLEAMRTGLKISGPQLSGSSLNGDLYDFRADVVTPRDLSMKLADIEALSGRIEFRDGRRVDIRADHAQIDIPGQKVTLDTGIAIASSDGYEATATRVEVDIRAAVLTATGPVIATGPPGRIEAGGMTIEPAGAGPIRDENDALIRFTGGVTLRYVPGMEETER